MMPNGSPVKYHSIEDLMALTSEALASLVDLIPTDRQRQYKLMLDRHMVKHGVVRGVGSDAREKEELLSLLAQYGESGLVPAGEVWVNPAKSTLERARLNEGLVEVVAEKKTATPKALIPLVGIVVMIVVVMFFLMMRRRGKTAAGLGTTTVTRTPTATPLNSPTPTPLALENQDRVIRSGDAASDRGVAYPVSLQVQFPGDDQPRVFVVQRRMIQTAEWDFDKNPDVASFVNGMSVRPIIGIPWSAENASLFTEIRKGTRFILQMNTGGLNRYTFASVAQVKRSDTSALRQVAPGLVLVLIGERDEDGQLTAQRTVVTAAYQADRELARDGVLLPVGTQTVPTTTPTPMPTPVDRVNVEVMSVSSHLPTRSVAVALRVFNDRQTKLAVGPDAVWITFGYTPKPLGPRLPAEGLKPFELLPGQARNLK